MNQLRVREFGKNVLRITPYDEKVLGKSAKEDYASFSNYFRELILIVAEHVTHFTIILEVTEKKTCMTLYLNKKQAKKVDLIKADLLAAFDGDIENVGIKATSFGVAVEILDVFFEFNG